jgi:Na+-translocating ferredoxin:NAD+ oxidoreductase RnfA subunit
VISEVVLQVDFQCMNIGKESLPLFSKLVILPLVNSNCAII